MYKRHSWRDDSKVLACQKLVRDAERKEQKKKRFLHLSECKNASKKQQDFYTFNILYRVLL